MPILPCWITKSLLLAGLAASSCDALAVPRAVGSTVKTSKGSVSGYAGSDYNRYVVPYAQAPTGARRFADPVAPATFKTYDGSNLPPLCPQAGSSSISEDCLFMSIYTPSGATTSSKLPVLFWVHGGTFYEGGLSDPAIDGSVLASAQDMVVITVQYRLGALGFLHSDALGVSGNFGLKDIIMALNYVKTEISAFGGDADRVTVAGQSSGAELVKSLFVTPSATSLFARAILHSAPLDFFDQSPELANFIGDKTTSDPALACTTIACLRSAPLGAILTAQGSVLQQGLEQKLTPTLRYADMARYKTVVDGTLVTRNFRDVVANGQALEGFSKPIIFTTMKEEAASTIAVASKGSPLPTDLFQGLIYTFFPERIGSILGSGLYDLSLYTGDDAVREDLVVLGTDFIWTCPNQQTAVKLSSSGQTVYQAEFDSGIKYVKSKETTFINRYVDHQDDLRVLFNPSKNINLTRAQRQTVKEVQARWGAFAKTGSPNAAGYGTWFPVASGANLNLLQLGNGSQGQSAFSATQRTDVCAIGSGVYSPA